MVELSALAQSMLMVNDEVVENLNKLAERNHARQLSESFNATQQEVVNTLQTNVKVLLPDFDFNRIPANRTIKVELLIDKAGGIRVNSKGAPHTGASNGGQGGQKTAVTFGEKSYESITACCEGETSGTNTDGNHAQHHCKQRINKAAKKSDVTVTFAS